MNNIDMPIIIERIIDIFSMTLINIPEIEVNESPPSATVASNINSFN